MKKLKNFSFRKKCRYKTLEVRALADAKVCALADVKVRALADVKVCALADVKVRALADVKVRALADAKVCALADVTGIQYNPMSHNWKHSTPLVRTWPYKHPRLTLPLYTPDNPVHT